MGEWDGNVGNVLIAANSAAVWGIADCTKNSRLALRGRLTHAGFEYFELFTSSKTYNTHCIICGSMYTAYIM